MKDPFCLKSKIIGNPLLVKHCTPIRSRIGTNQIPLNSTPISYLRMPSPISNKQNQNNSNSIEEQTTQRCQNKQIQKRLLGHCKSFSKTTSFGEYKFNKKKNHQHNLFDCSEQPILNLKPIVQINSKMSQPPLSFSYSKTIKSLTPNLKKQPQTLNTKSKQKYQNADNLNKFSNSMFPNLNQSSSITNLRTSSSLSNLFQKRSKTPTRLGSLAFSSISRKASCSPNHKQSISFGMQECLLTVSKQTQTSQVSCSTINQSSIQNSLLEFQKSTCFNHPTKKAKYKVRTTYNKLSIQNQENEYDLVFCSKCAIDLVQKGFTVEELTDSQLQDAVSLHTSPRQHSLLGQPKSVRNTFVSFKSSCSPEVLQGLKRAGRVKQQLKQQIDQRYQTGTILQKKFTEQKQTIDCYYNSLISYIQQQRKKDIQALQNLKIKVQQALLLNGNCHPEKTCDLEIYLNEVEEIIRKKNTDIHTLKFLGDIQSTLQQIDTNKSSVNLQYSEIVVKNNKTILTYPSPIQDQFDAFVTYFDTKGKLSFNTFDQIALSKPFPKNNPLRFSFEKALQNQNRQKSLIINPDMINPLEQQSEDDYDDNSFCQDHMTQTSPNLQNFQQKPFRTLFAEQEDILHNDGEEQQHGKSDMYSPTFKAI